MKAKAFWSLLAFISAILSLLSLEIFSNLFFIAETGSFYYLTDISNPPQEHKNSPWTHYSLLNPYFSRSRRPGLSVFDFLDRQGRGFKKLQAKTGTSETPAWAELKTNNFGFFSPYDYPFHDANAFIIGIFGGSVAAWFSLQGEAALMPQLATLPSLQGRSLVLLNFGHGGYKQPQQLIVLNYFLAVGQHFDLIINIDGFNEASLGAMNLAEGIDASLPNVKFARAFNTILRSTYDDNSLLYLARFAELRAELSQIRAVRADAATALTYVIADSRMRMVQRQLDLLESSPPEPVSPGTDFVFSPDLKVDQRKLPRSIADDWGRASDMMARLAEMIGAHYIHILQANQYHTSRQFSDLERRIAVKGKSEHRPGVATVYPLLRREGQRLRRNGIDFHDGEDAFSSIPEPVYSDRCCHYNQRGNEALAKFIVERLRNSLENREVDGPRHLFTEGVRASRSTPP